MNFYRVNGCSPVSLAININACDYNKARLILLLLCDMHVSTSRGDTHGETNTGHNPNLASVSIPYRSDAKASDRYLIDVDPAIQDIYYICGRKAVGWVNSLRPSDAHMRQHNIPTLLQIMTGRLFGAKPLSEPMRPYWQLDPKEHTSGNFI